MLILVDQRLKGQAKSLYKDIYTKSSNVFKVPSRNFAFLMRSTVMLLGFCAIPYCYMDWAHYFPDTVNMKMKTCYIFDFFRFNHWLQAEIERF